MFDDIVGGFNPPNFDPTEDGQYSNIQDFEAWVEQVSQEFDEFVQEQQAQLRNIVDDVAKWYLDDTAPEDPEDPEDPEELPVPLRRGRLADPGHRMRKRAYPSYQDVLNELEDLGLIGYGPIVYVSGGFYYWSLPKAKEK